MNDERGEAVLLSIVILLVMSSLFMLSVLELEAEFRLLQKRTNLFLCVKETKEEMKSFISFMGKTNWALENLDKAKLLALLIPGAQGAALKTDQLKKFIIKSQDIRLPHYLQKIRSLKQKGCPVHHDLLLTPFHLGAQGFIRNAKQTTILRSPEWKQFFSIHPYRLNMNVNARNYMSTKSSVNFHLEENEEKPSFLSFLP